MGLDKILTKYQYFVAHQVPSIERLRSGILAFDIVTGGGIPIGRFIEFHGDKSTGKSTMALKIANQFLQMDNRKAVYIDFENTFDPKWSSHFISDMERMIVVQPDYGELGVDLFIELHKNADEVGFIIIDSLATIVPTKEAENDAFSSHIAPQARLISSMFRRVLPLVSQNNRSKKPITVILINQIRNRIDGYGRPGIVKPGGKMQDAIVSMDIRFYIKDYKVVNSIPVIAVYQVQVEKNKVGGHPKRAAQFELCITPYKNLKIGDCDDLRLYISFMRKLNLLIREGNKWKLNENVFKNQDEVITFLQNSSEVKEKLANEIIEMSNKDLSFLLEDSDDSELHNV